MSRPFARRGRGASVLWLLCSRRELRRRFHESDFAFRALWGASKYENVDVGGKACSDLFMFLPSPLTDLLTFHDRRECWSLLERLHLGGYVHNSVYERNVLMQSGPVQWSPLQEEQNPSAVPPDRFRPVHAYSQQWSRGSYGVRQSRQGIPS